MDKTMRKCPFCGVRPSYWLQNVTAFIGCRGSRCHVKPFVRSRVHKNGGSTDPFVLRMWWNRRAS